MSLTRILVLVAAITAAGITALLVRGFLGTKTQAEAAPKVPMSRVLVAARQVEVGTRLTSSDIRWMEWPTSAVHSSFITQETQPMALDEVATGAVARSPLTSGQPVTGKNVIRADGGGFMAATLSPGKRAYGVEVSAGRGAGGFILPNDRVDVLLTRKVSQTPSGEGNYQAVTVLRNLRVLAVDQTAGDDADSKVIVGKTATLEVTDREAEMLALADAMGDLSLTLRSLAKTEDGFDGAKDEDVLNKGSAEGITILRYGMKGIAAAIPAE
jgi:pilus assembly protein CpaB